MTLQFKAAWLSALLLLGTPALADTNPLPPFKAVYTTEFDLGISLSGEAVRELRQDTGGPLAFQLRGLRHDGGHPRSIVLQLPQRRDDSPA